jgi:N-acylglucosamine 2-epimerase
MAFAELYKATKNDYYKEVAVKTYLSIEKRQDNPKGKWSKSAGGRDIKNFSLPMIMCNMALSM